MTVSDHTMTNTLLNIYERLEQHFGNLQWWPADTTEEIIIGAILVQSVSWSNTTKAINALRNHDLLNFEALHCADVHQIETDIRPTRYYKMKTKKLRAFAEHVHTVYGGKLQNFLQQPLSELRNELLGIYGIGRETADAIILYAAKLPSFVIDAYTKRIFRRLGLCRESDSYEQLREWFMTHLSPDVAMFNQYHAMIDALGNSTCTNSNPSCSSCPLQSMCRYAREVR